MAYTAEHTYLLLVFDGWGYSESTEGNAIAKANTPHWDHLWDNYPHSLISGSGVDVGLPHGQMGNSEVGHLNIGAGRMVPQELGRINIAIKDGSFDSNSVLIDAMNKVQTHHGALHIFGLLSDGGVHSHEQHIHAIAWLAKAHRVERLYIHAFLDGRDTPPKSAEKSISALETTLADIPCGHIASLTGRYYAMDRDQRWERVQQVYDMLTTKQAPHHADSAIEGLNAAYTRDETDEFVSATCIVPEAVIQDGDGIIFMNFRADRARQLSRAFTDPNFDGFERQNTPKLSCFVTLTEYASDINASVAYPPQRHRNVLGEFIANQGLHQLRIAETEKYAHVTFFFNGGIEVPFKNEERLLIPSPKVATYDLKPEMSAPLLTEKLVDAIKSKKYDVIICNYANPDMVGHTGKMDAAVQAVEVIDKSLGEIVAALQQHKGEALITADHGNVEQMLNRKTEQAHTAHTSNPVPLLYIGRPAHFASNTGTLCDIAPTFLKLMGYTPPPEMTGNALLSLD